MRTVACLVSATVLLASGCTAGGSDDRWTRAAEPPLSARYAPLLAWTGTEVLAFGGHTGPACPPGADCAALDDGTRDGAAYDVEGDSWRPLADAPVELDRFTGHAWTAGRLVVGDATAWWAYDPAADAWRGVPLPAEPVGEPETAADGRVATVAGRRVQVLDVATGAWSALPPDPLEPRLRDGGVFLTDAGVVLTGVAYGEAAPDEPTLTQADRWDGERWVRLPATGMLGPLTHWTGRRLVGAELGGADGGEVDGWDRWYPSGGVLDPATGGWSPLTDAPGLDDLDEDDWRLEAAAGSRVATGGLLHDVRAGTWTHLGHPASAVTDHATAVLAGDVLVVVGGTDEDREPRREAWLRTLTAP